MDKDLKNLFNQVFGGHKAYCLLTDKELKKLLLITTTISELETLDENGVEVPLAYWQTEIQIKEISEEEALKQYNKLEAPEVK